MISLKTVTLNKICFGSLMVEHVKTQKCDSPIDSTGRKKEIMSGLQYG